MEYVRLGRTGLPVSRLCLGTMTFGLQCDEPTSVSILDAAYDAGITFLDTADVYPLGGDTSTVGRTEDIVGRWLAASPGRRDDIVLATKCVGAMGERPWQRGASRRHIVEAVDASLRRLGVERIDLYQLHSPDPETPIEESLQALDDLVRAGKVGYVGCSNFLAYQLARALGRSEALGLARFDSVQPRYNLLFRQIERELLPLAEQDGVGVIPYNPIAGGMLTGKHKRGAPTESTRFTLGSASTNYQGRYWNDAAFDTVDALGELATEAGVSLTTLAVRWVLANPVITAPIIGASRPEQLADSIAALDAPLPDDLAARMDELTTQYRMGDAAR